MTPRATYRLQFHKGFAFADAERRADYFADLGISHIYASPILKARAGSLHGYDVVDHREINPELGGEEGFRALAAALAKRGLGLIVDIVPNHVAVGRADNGWWLDLLAHGPDSRFAAAFDIDWDAPGLEGKVFAPFLGEPPEAALAHGDLKLVREDGRLSFAYYDHRFPLRPEDQGLTEQNLSLDDLKALLVRQNFVLADWRQADARINWRRFFDITGLAAIRIGEPYVFEQVHAKIFELYAEGLIDGLRIDHVDGLADPRGYCRTLRQRLEALRPGAYLVVEKILAEGESLPADWQVDGTTGYDFLDQASALLHQEDGGALERLWQSASGRGLDFEAEEKLARGEMLRSKFAGQLQAVARAFAKVVNREEKEIAEAVTAIVKELRCYRSYATGKPDSPGPGPFLVSALGRAAREAPDLAATIADLARLFDHGQGDPLIVDAIRRFSQLSAPVAAKAVEDTAFYRYGRLLSRNDVGCHPSRHRLAAADFHALMAGRVAERSRAMLTTATHDHKRGEDARMRLAVLSGHVGLWQRFADRPVPPGLDGGDVYQLYQTLFAAWPRDPDEAFAARLEGWCDKFLREGKLRSSWTQPDQDYETRFRSYTRALILDPAQASFRESLEGLLKALESAISQASLVQLVLRNTLPGGPDLYQGCEFEDLSLVDPDNRRPVDFSAREAALAEGKSLKQKVLADLLKARAADPWLWEKGDYQPLPVPKGTMGFSRRHGVSHLLVYVRLGSGAVGGSVRLDGDYRDILSGRLLPIGEVNLADLFAALPATVLYARG